MKNFWEWFRSEWSLPVFLVGGFVGAVLTRFLAG